MLTPRFQKTLALVLLALYLPLVASLDLWHNHGTEDGHHETCAACHFAASHAPVPEAVVLVLAAATFVTACEPVDRFFDIIHAPNSRAPPCVLASFIVMETNSMKKDTRDEGTSDLCGAAVGSRELCA